MNPTKMKQRRQKIRSQTWSNLSKVSQIRIRRSTFEKTNNSSQKLSLSYRMLNKNQLRHLKDQHHFQVKKDQTKVFRRQNKQKLRKTQFCKSKLIWRHWNDCISYFSIQFQYLSINQHRYQKRLLLKSQIYLREDYLKLISINILISLHNILIILVQYFINFIMSNENFQTPKRKKTSSHFEDSNIKSRTIETCFSRQKQFSSSRINKDDDWQFYQNRRESRLNTLFRIRKDKLMSITKQNQKIFIKLNEQQSHYKPAFKKEDIHPHTSRISLAKDRQIFGHLCNFQSPTIFMNYEQTPQRDTHQESKSIKSKGSRAISRASNYQFRSIMSTLPLRPPSKQNNYNYEEITSKKLASNLNFFTPNRKKLSDIYTNL